MVSINLAFQREGDPLPLPRIQSLDLTTLWQQQQRRRREEQEARDRMVMSVPTWLVQFVRNQPEQRALCLLLSLLDDRQKEEFRAHGWFDVYTKKPWLQSILTEKIGPVRMGLCRHCGRAHVQNWCVYPKTPGNVVYATPWPDDLVAFKVFADAGKLLGIANRYPTPYCFRSQ